ncbi:hypothetical protein BGZ80_002461 [Entomortierella chlamydospora]|uniref:Alcohol acetyltransferase n=1 Tax=Entomortierella chlamydospora TaxID=101097 RepID=A0A9P6MPN2_9FUNG|nr:hypothetical protein BGZ79_006682 [Entomortierella chlamydospora]KAG0009372.1 hypothetical protein BGZ80_002461 [Entomortierella chlamydospora]
MALQFVRPLDMYARYCVASSVINHYKNFLIAHKIQLNPTEQTKLGGPNYPSWKSPYEWAQLLLYPMAYLLNQHPSLTVTIGDHLGNIPVYLRLKYIDLHRLIRVAPIKTSTEIGRVIEQEHNISFNFSDNTSPLWRLVVAPIEDDESSFYLIFSFHHAICDGRSAAALTEQLIGQLNSKPRQPENTPFSSPYGTTRISITSNKPIPAPMEDRFQLRLSVCTLVKEVAKQFPVPGFVRRAFETKYWAGDIDVSPEAPNETELCLLQLTTQETSRVVQASRRHSTTVQAILYAASVFATKSVFMSNAEDRNSAEETITFGTMISLRDRVPEPISPTDQGNYIAIMPHDGIYIREKSSFWSTASDYRKEIFETISTPQKVRSLMKDLGMMRCLPKKAGAWEKAIKSPRMQHGRSMTIIMSNLGRVLSQSQNNQSSVSGEAPQYLVDDTIMSQSPFVNASAFLISAATTNGKMTISTAWQKAAFKERARGDLFASEFKRILLEAVDDGAETYLFEDAKRTYDSTVTLV